MPEQTYLRPSGYKIQMIKPAGGRAWRLVGTVAEGTLCHKPSTVSGGGKSEISKPITDAIIQGPVFVADFKKDFDRVEELINRSYGGRFRDGRKTPSSRPILSPERSLGSVIKLLTPAPDLYSDEYSKWLDSIPQYQRELVFVVKRFYKPEWGENWREHFSVDIINGVPGHELKCDNRRLVTNYLRVGLRSGRRLANLRFAKGFLSGVKTRGRGRHHSIGCRATLVFGKSQSGVPTACRVKFVKNCEQRLFQRPDDAIHPGYDKQTESDFASPGNFFSNYEAAHGERCRRNDRGRNRFRQVHPADAAADPRSGRGQPTEHFLFARRILASWTASLRRIRGICSFAPTW